MPTQLLKSCRERESAHSNHQTLLAEHNDRHKKHQARCALSALLGSMTLALHETISSQPKNCQLSCMAGTEAAGIVRQTLLDYASA